MKHLLVLAISFFIFRYSFSQNVGINISNPVTELQVDSTITIGKTYLSFNATPGKKNLLKFGDYNSVTIGEEVQDDELHIRYGNLIFSKAANAKGSGYIGVQTDTPTAGLDLNTTVRLRPGASLGKVLTSDANGNATWQNVSTAAEVGFSARLASDIFIGNTETTVANYIETLDDGGNNFNPATGTFTAPQTGIYSFIAVMNYQDPGTTNAMAYTTRVKLTHLGSSGTYTQITTPYAAYPGYGVGFSFPFVLKLQAGDVVAISAYIDGGVSNLSGNATPATTTFSGTLLH